MREILFRGKRKEDGKWIEGYLAAYDLICPSYPEDTLNATGEYCGQVPYVGFVEVDSESVGQSTTLKDKNGRRIFEGDIIQIRFEGDAEPPGKPESWYETGKVIWHDQLHGWYVVFDSPDGVPIQEYDGCDDVFLIGNIHDHPELMEDAQHD